jgi:hypothetical protein
MLPGPGTAVVKAAMVIPVTLLVLFACLYGLGFLCGPERRKYAMNFSQQAMSAAGLLVHGPASQPRQLSSGRKRRS